MMETPQEVISNFGVGLGVIPERIKAFKNQMLVAANKEQVVVPKSKFVDWAFLIHDFNRMHIFQGYASEAGFKKTPVHGTLIAAYEEQYVLRVLDILKEFTGKDLFYNSQRIKFEEPLFPKVRVARAGWDLEKAVVNEKGINLSISATDGKGKKYISSKVFLGYEPKQKDSQEIIGFLSGNDIIHKTSMEIKGGERDSFYKCLNKKVDEQIFMMHPAAFIPATILELSSRKTGRPEGTYRSINFEFYNMPELGIIETILRMKKSPKNLGKEGFAYKFNALCLQNKKPILSGDVICVSPVEYKLN